MPKLTPKNLDLLLDAFKQHKPLPISCDIQGIPAAYEDIIHEEIHEFEEDYQLLLEQSPAARIQWINKITQTNFSELAKIKELFYYFAKNKITPNLSDLPEYFIKFFAELFQSAQTSVNDSEQAALLPVAPSFTPPKQGAQTPILSRPIPTVPINMALITASPIILDSSPALSDVSSPGEPPALDIENSHASEQWSRLVDSTTTDLTSMIREVSHVGEISDLSTSIIATELTQSLTHLKEVIADSESKKAGLISLSKSLSNSLSTIKELDGKIKQDEIDNILQSPQVLSHVEECFEQELTKQEKKIVEQLGKETPKSFAAKCLFARSNSGFSNPKFNSPARDEISKACKFQILKRSFIDTHEKCLELSELEEEKIQTAKKCESLLKESQQLNLAISCPSSFFQKQISEYISPPTPLPLTPFAKLTRTQSS